MKRLLTVSLLLLLLFGGCGRRQNDFFDAFRGGYTAEVEGTLYGLAFAAKIEMGAADAGEHAPATVTFYAPEALSGTVLARAADGTVTLTCGGLTASDLGEIGGALFGLFPTSGAVLGTEVTEAGHTRLALEATELEFLSDGMPYSVKTPHATVTVVYWEACGK